MCRVWIIVNQRHCFILMMKKISSSFSVVNVSSANPVQLVENNMALIVLFGQFILMKKGFVIRRNRLHCVLFHWVVFHRKIHYVALRYP